MTMSTLVVELHRAIRCWRGRPVLAVTAALTLAIGLGVNVTVMSVVEALILRPLPAVKDASRVMVSRGNPFSLRTCEAFGQHQRAFDEVAAWQQWSLNLFADGEARRVHGLFVTPNYFHVLGVSMFRGRAFAASAPGADESQEAVLTARFWRTRFGASNDVIGRTITLNRLPVTIVGVTADRFEGTDLGEPVDVFLNVAAIDAVRGAAGPTALLTNPGRHWLRAVARLAPGAAAAAAQVLSNRAVREANGDIHGPLPTVTWRTLDEAAFPGSARAGATRALAVLFGVAACVLLVACANVANLLIAGGEARRSEFGVRLALGAGTWRLAGQVLAETLLLASAASIAGLLLAFWAASVLSAVRFTAHVPVTLAGAIDLRVLAVAAGLVLLTTVACGMAPAIRAAREDLAPLLGRTPAPRVRSGRFGIRDALVALQVGASVLLLIGAGLFVATLRNQQQVTPGFRITGVAYARLSVALAGYGPEAGADFYERLENRLAATPGVAAAARAIAEPLGAVAFVRTLASPGDPQPLEAEANVVGPGYFALLGIPIVEGTDFDASSPKGAVILNETLARRLWPGGGAVGRIVEARDTGAPLGRVIGVARDSKYDTLQDRAVPFVYSRIADDYDPTQVVFVRGARSGRELLGPLRRAVREIDPRVPAIELASLDDHVASTLSQARATAGFAGVLAALTTLLAGVGLYGVLSVAAAARRRELAVRLALGARVRHLAAAVGGRTAISAGAGLAGGWIAAASLTSIVSSLLYGVTPASPWLAALVAATILVVVAGATAIPVARAVQAPPASILRE